MNGWMDEWLIRSISHRVYLWMEGIWSEFGEIRVARGKRGVIRWFFGLKGRGECLIKNRGEIINARGYGT